MALELTVEDEEIVEPAAAIPLGTAEDDDVDAQTAADLAWTMLPRTVREHAAVDVGAVGSGIEHALVLA